MGYHYAMASRGAHPDGLRAPEIAAALAAPVPSRTLQSRLSRLVRDGRLARNGRGRWARYQAPAPTAAGGPASHVLLTPGDAIRLLDDRGNSGATLDRPAVVDGNV